VATENLGLVFSLSIRFPLSKEVLFVKNRVFLRQLNKAGCCPVAHQSRRASSAASAILALDLVTNISLLDRTSLWGKSPKTASEIPIQKIAPDAVRTYLQTPIHVRSFFLCELSIAPPPHPAVCLHFSSCQEEAATGIGSSPELRTVAPCGC
jgi:hypothetical protein